MRSILVVNAKGGSGKTTISTNLASYFTGRGRRTVLADYDVQQSSMDWLAARPGWREPITGVGINDGPIQAPANADIVIMDSPARVEGRDLAELVRRADLVLVPVLPSPFDIDAAAGFIADILMQARMSGGEDRLAVVANRVNRNTISYLRLQKFLRSLRIPFIATLRDTQNYIRAAEHGIGIFELAPSMVQKDLDQWRPLTVWINKRLGEAAAGAPVTIGTGRNYPAIDPPPR